MYKGGNRCGAALVLAVVIAFILSMLIGAALLYVRQHNNLGWHNARTEASLLMGEGGINDEVKVIAANVGGTVGNLSSQPVVYSGQTLISPYTGAVVRGRPGTITGSNGNYWVYSTITDPSTNATPVAWDGTTTSFWIVSTAYVNGNWRRAYVKANPNSILNIGLDAVVALAAYNNNSNAIGLQNATVTINGTAITNGKMSNSSSTVIASNCINANTQSVGSSQFSASNVASGGTLTSQPNPLIYPTVTTILSRATGLTWNGLIASNSNATRVYTYSGNASSMAINAANCVQVNPGFNNMLSNTGTGQYTNAWANLPGNPGSNTTLTVSSVTGSAPITVTTSANHGLSTGDSVTIYGVAGNTAANGKYTVTVPNGAAGAKSFTISQTSNGTYTTGGALIKNLAITTAAASGGTVTVTTPVNHNLSTGMKVAITGNSLANGTWTITVPNGNAGKKSFTFSAGGSGSVAGGLIVLRPVQSMIFEPGDYYFSTVNVLSDPTTSIVIDSQAFASGGTPGQVRFWISSTLGGSGGPVQNDAINIPITATTASGSLVPDPRLFRVYYGQDKGIFTFDRPSGYTSYDGSLPVDFSTYGAVYAVTKLPGDTSSLSGTEIDFVGIGGSVILSGALIADKVVFHGTCTVNFDFPTTGPGDPEGGAGMIGGYSDGG